MSTFYAGFKDAPSAIRMAYEILDSGVLSDAVSILAHERHMDMHSFERISMPAATRELDDDLSGVWEADDGQELAEMDAFETLTQGQRDSLGLRESAMTGFAADEDGGAPAERVRVESLESFPIPGFGLVLGGGSLATAAIAAANPDSGLTSIERHFYEEGLDDETSRTLLKTFADGGLVIAVELSGGSDQAIRLEAAAELRGATVIGTFGAPRFNVQDLSRS